jgi:prepilin-type processing-associated H-X9-DG protein
VAGSNILFELPEFGLTLNRMASPYGRNGRPLLQYAFIACLLVVMFFLFFPVGGGMNKESARKTTCLSNTKQIALAMVMYANDYDSRFPLASAWMDSLTSEVKNEHIFHCPALPNTWSLSDDQLAKAPYGYAMNRFLAGVNSEKLTEPEKMPLVYESKDLSRSVTGYLTDLPVPGRHNGSNNFAMADGHAKSIGIMRY